MEFAAGARVPRVPDAGGPAHAVRGGRAGGARDAPAGALVRAGRRGRRHPDPGAGAGRRARGRAGGDARPAPVPAPAAGVPAVLDRGAAAADGRSGGRCGGRRTGWWRAGSSRGGASTTTAGRGSGWRRCRTCTRGSRARWRWWRRCRSSSTRATGRRGCGSSGRCCGSRESEGVAPVAGSDPVVLVAPSTAQDPSRVLLRAALEGLAGEPVRVIATWNGPEPASVPVPGQRGGRRLAVVLEDDAARATSWSRTAATGR